MPHLCVSPARPSTAGDFQFHVAFSDRSGFGNPEGLEKAESLMVLYFLESVCRETKKHVGSLEDPTAGPHLQPSPI